MPDANHVFEIPVLTDVLVPGKPASARHGAQPEAPLPAPARSPSPARDDARRVAERVRDRVVGYLGGDGRALIDARCREVVQQHATVLVGEVSRQVLLALGPEIERWVNEAIEEALANRERPPA